MEVFGIAITLLTGLLGVLAWRNGRWMKQAHQDSLALLAHIQQSQEEARKMAQQNHQQVTALLERIQEAMQQNHRDAMALLAQIQASAQQNHRDAMALLERIQQGQEETRREVAETLRYIADLIVAESEKTRQVIRQSR